MRKASELMLQCNGPQFRGGLRHACLSVSGVTHSFRVDISNMGVDMAVMGDTGQMGRYTCIMSRDTQVRGVSKSACCQGGQKS
ncbi:hypothetical protein DPMN_066727 [Dreissena polymorpha]|uniref:Uncharacterized protein n=1 Tax=Dreissena polymorpha TaxID=45954 RepID=A0A9D4BKS4_DREPO|nr:hypothetical protein DPMN_066727 [Dreissena polymorpha]